MYEKSREELTKGIFLNPPAQFRGAPFWAWNAELDKNELLWQIDRLKEMGFGGFFMHSRSGMSTEYLGKQFMELVRGCTQYAKENGMLSYLYDEDRWSSGAAGGYVTKDKKYRQKRICLSKLNEDETAKKYGGDREDYKLIKSYDIIFDKDGRLDKYSVISKDEAAAGEKWHSYCMINQPSGWYNGYTYLDTLNKEAVDKFIEVTYEAYKREVGTEFGKEVPAIFTDEPNYGIIYMKAYARDGQDVQFPWTQTFAQTFKDSFGYDITDRIPELVWNLKSDKPSKARYDFYRHVSQMFAEAYSDRIGEWCQKNGIAFTGHLLYEEKLYQQMVSIGEAMRNYRGFTVPGIDILCNNLELSTAKQAQSVVRQYGRDGMASELYGVTGWDFDFRGHKYQGDWQAALGVTLRVPHLAWVSMRGSAKRDYPASISYQSAWYKEYDFVENHFARLNTALTRGLSKVEVAVIHPIESEWLTEGVREHTSLLSAAAEERFQNLINWLLRGQIDFDFVSESLLPELYLGTDGGFNVGKMKYKAVFVPPLATIRQTTLDALLQYAESGGRVIVSGNPPVCVDGTESTSAQKLYSKAEKVNFSQTDILQSLEDVRDISVYSQSGDRRKDLIYNMRREGENRWLFIAHCDLATRYNGDDCACDKIKIAVKGCFKPFLYDTLSGEISEVPFEVLNGKTLIEMICYPFDSFLFNLIPTGKNDCLKPQTAKTFEETSIEIPDTAEYCLKENNVAVLDLCEWSLDGKVFEKREEILRIDKKIRLKFGYPLADGTDVQPWCIQKKKPSVFVYEKFIIESEIDVQCFLNLEQAEEIIFNGKDVKVESVGYFVDKDIKTVKLGILKKGKNVLIVKVPVSERISLENMFLTGSFGVRVEGSYFKIVAKPNKIAYGSVTNQGMPFYGAEITYKIPFECENGELNITSDYYNGALISAAVDGKTCGKIVYPPYGITVSEISAGKHILELTLFASRINTFGALHLCASTPWKGPNMWYTEKNMWAYEYQLADVGIMKKPILTLKK